MKRILAASSLALLLNSFSAQAGQGEVLLGLDIGVSGMSIDEDFVITDTSEDGDRSERGFPFSYVAGYHFANNVVAEANLVYNYEINFFGTAFENYQVDELKGLVGYSFQLTHALSLVPFIGFSRWNLKANEGTLFNSGPEAKEEYDGTDLTYKLRLNFAFNSLIALSYSYAITEADFGSIHTSQIGLLFEF